MKLVSAKLVYVSISMVCLVAKVTTQLIPFKTKIAGVYIGAASESPFVCPGEGNYPVPGKECTGVYYSCVNGVAVEEQCAGSSVFDPTLQFCTSASTAPCRSNSTTVTSTIGSTPTTSTTKSSESTVLSTESTIIWSEDVTLTEMSTESIETSSVSQTTTEELTSSTSSTSQPITTTTATTTQATTTTVTTTKATTSTFSSPITPFVCSSDGNFANPNSCKSFFICSNGIAYYFECPSDLVFNPKGGYCDYASNVPSCQNLN